MKIYFIAFMLTISIGVFGCGSDATLQSNTANTNAAGNSPGPVNAPMTPASNINPAAPGNSAANVEIKKPKNASPGGPGSDPMTKPAPDNSEVKVMLNENLIRTRTFKSHPTLLKVEEISPDANPDKKTIKVYLKGGDVKEIAPGKIGDPMTESAANILSAIGSH